MSLKKMKAYNSLSLFHLNMQSCNIEDCVNAAGRDNPKNLNSTRVGAIVSPASLSRIANNGRDGIND